MERTKICWTKNGIDDSIILEANTVEELQEKAKAEIERRKPLENYWSENLPTWQKESATPVEL